MLLDEPSLGLAPMLVEEIFEIVQRLNREQKLTVLLVEQNATLALAIAEHGYVMENGRIVLEGSAEALRGERGHQGVLSRAHRGGRPEVLPRREALQAAKAVAELSVHAFTVYDMIARGAAVHGDAPAVIQGERALSFRALQERVDELATGLAGLGLGAGDRICVLAQNDTAYLELYGACARQGLIAYPINWRLTAQEVERVVERARPAMMVVDASTQALVGDWLGAAGVTHRYQLGDGAGAGFAPLASLYRKGPAPAPADDARRRALRGDLDRGGGRGAPRGRAHPRQRDRGQSHHDRLPRLHRAGPLPGRPAALPRERARHGPGPPARGRRQRDRVALRPGGGGAAHRSPPRHPRLGLPPGAGEPARRGREGGERAAEPDPRLRPRRAPDHPAPAREDEGAVLDRVRPVGDQRVRDHPARGRPARRLRAAGARRPGARRGRLRSRGAGRHAQARSSCAARWSSRATSASRT